MKLPRLNFVHICENAFLSLNQRINIIGDFDKIYIFRKNKEEPLAFSFYVVTNFSVEPNKKYTQNISLVNLSNGKEVISQSIKQESKGDKIGLMLNLKVTFPTLGLYNIIIKFDGEVYNELKLEVFERLTNK